RNQHQRRLWVNFAFLHPLHTTSSATKTTTEHATVPLKEPNQPAGLSQPRRGLVAVPAAHVVGVGGKVRAGLEEAVLELEVQVVGLDVVHDEQRRHRARELAEGVEHVLGLERNAVLELLVMDLGAAAHAWAVGPGAGGVGVEGPARAEL